MEEIDDNFDPDLDSLVRALSDKFHRMDSSFSSDADSGELRKLRPAFVRAEGERFFEYEDPVNHSLDEGNCSHVFLGKNKVASAAVLGGATVVWVVFLLLEYHFVTLICHLIILALGVAFFWSNASIIVNKKPPLIREVRLPRQTLIEAVSLLCDAMDDVISVLLEIASVRDLKKFLQVIFSLWAVSIIGSLCSFLTLSYIFLVFFHTAPILYEKYGDKAVELAEQTIAVIKKTYAKLEKRVTGKIPVGQTSKIKTA